VSHEPAPADPAAAADPEPQPEFAPATELSEKQGVLALPTRVAEQTARVILLPIPEPAAVDASQALRNLVIPDPPRSPLCDALAEGGYTVGEEELIHPWNRQFVATVLAIRAPPARKVVFLLHVEPPILKVFDEEYQKNIVYLRELFPGGSALTVVSRGLPDVQGSYLKIFRGWGSGGESGLQARFVSWQRLEELDESSFPPEEVAEELFVNDVLGAPAAGGVAGDGPHDSITDHESEIVELLADQARSDPNGSEEFFKAFVARLRRRLPQSWSDQLNSFAGADPVSAATSLVRWAISKGKLQEDTALIGLLIGDLSELVGFDQKAHLVALIEQHALLPAAKIAELKGA
jgi:hypothetical protein